MQNYGVTRGYLLMLIGLLQLTGDIYKGKNSPIRKRVGATILKIGSGVKYLFFYAAQLYLRNKEVESVFLF